MARSGRQVEAMTAEQAEIVGQDVTVERPAELRADVVERHRRNRQFGRMAREAVKLKDEQRRGGP